MSTPRLTVVAGAAEMKIQRPQTVGEILAEPLPTYVVRPLLARRAVHVLYGDANCGKTFFALDLAARVATGGTWQGMRIKAAPVLYVAAEGLAGIGRRLRALVQQYPGLPAAPLRFIRQPIDLIGDLADLTTRASDLAEDQGDLGLIVLDTLAQTIGGRDENGPDMAQYVASSARLADKTGSPVLIVHHGGKDASRGARGHSALRGNVDAIFKISTGDDGTRTVTAEKVRDDEIEPFAYRLRPVPVGTDQDGIEQTSCVIEYLDAQPAKLATRKPLSGSAQRLLYRLASEIAAVNAEQGRLASNGKPLIERARLIEVWQATQKAAGRTRTSPSYVARPLAELVSCGHLEPVAGGDAWTLA